MSGTSVAAWTMGSRRWLMISCDCGTATAWYARNVKMKPTMIGSLSGTLLSMGSGVPYAIAAKFCHPDRPAIALVGDGAMQMNGLAELITAAKYWRRWEDPRLIVLVLNNRDLNFVTWEQRATEGDDTSHLSRGPGGPGDHPPLLRRTTRGVHPAHLNRDVMPMSAS